MKIWYQSMSRENPHSGYSKALNGIIARAKDPGTEVEVHGLATLGGMGGGQFRYLEYLETGEVLKNVSRAEAEGFDAFLIGNITDPGLQEAREIANIPVLGLCETSAHLACMMGANFSLVTINAKFTPRIVGNIRNYGLEQKLVAANRMNVDDLANLRPTFDDAAARQSVFDQFDIAARLNVQAGAEVVIPAGGLIMALLAHAGVHTTAEGVPILNGIISLVKFGETAVKLNQIMGGRFTSKQLVYGPPPASQIAALRKYYGPDIYPSIKPAK